MGLARFEFVKVTLVQIHIIEFAHLGWLLLLARLLGLSLILRLRLILRLGIRDEIPSNGEAVFENVRSKLVDIF